VSCTGAVGLVLTADALRGSREGVAAPLAAIDLAMPHDLDPAIGDVPGVALIGLRRLAEELTPAESEGVGDVHGVRRIVTEEIQAFLSARRLANVTPTVVALRTMATGVVDGELARLDARLPELDPEVRAELELAVRRVADKLMHHPTVRVKELANSSGAVSYAAALAELFALDQDAVDAVTRPEAVRP
jgi:glutamyl-tRNA reductase